MNTEQQISAFIGAMFQPEDVVEIRRLPVAYSTWHLASDTGSIIRASLSANASRQNVYVGGLPRKELGVRGNDSVAMARAVWVEFDEKQLGIACDDPAAQIAESLKRISDAWIDPPCIVNHSGHGVWCFWLLHEAQQDIDAWRLAMDQLAMALNSDPSVTNPERIVRLPGLMNHRPPQHRAELIHCNPDVQYAWVDIVEPLHHCNMFEPPAPIDNAEEIVEQHAKKRGMHTNDRSVIDAFNAAVPLRDLLEGFGYRVIGTHFRRPGKEDPGMSGSIIKCRDGRTRSFHFSSNDKLYNETFGGKVKCGVCDPFDVFLKLQHGGDIKTAIKAAAAQLGIERPKQKRDQQVLGEVLNSPVAQEFADTFAELSGDDVKPIRLKLAGMIQRFTGNPYQVNRLLDQLATFAKGAA